MLKRRQDCIETATFKDQNEKEKERLLSMVVVGGGPTGTLVLALPELWYVS